MSKEKTAGLVLGAAAVFALGGTALAQDKVVWKTQGVTKSEIVLGSHTDLSGVAATFGVGVTNAIRLRFDDVNANGGIHGRKIRFVVEDAQYQVPRAVQAANKLINRDKIFAMVAGIGTPMNNAVLKDQLAAGVPNLFPITAAKSMYEPFHPLKFAGFAPYYHQIRAGIKYMVEQKGKKKICTMYQDTDFGQEVLAGITDQMKAMNMQLAETTTDKPTDTDFTAQLTKMRAADCDLIAMGVIVRDAIIPYSAARKMGWNVDMVSTSASFDLAVSGAQGGVTEGFHAMGYFDPPYPDTSSPEAKQWIAKYKEKYNADPTIASALGQVVGDLVVYALDRAGPDLTTEKLVKALEGITNYRDIFGGPPTSFGPEKRIGSVQSVMFQVQKGRWARVTEPLAF
jgi:branched-chain amino acid transport system substrate-binding protein